jgi:hypothetical protein
MASHDGRAASAREDTHYRRALTAGRPAPSAGLPNIDREPIAAATAQLGNRAPLVASVARRDGGVTGDSSDQTRNLTGSLDQSPDEGEETGSSMP